MQKDCSVIILAAGYSSRMGCAKFNLRLPDGTSFLENIVKQYSDFGCRQIIVLVNKEGKLFLEQNPIKLTTDVEYVVNEHPEYERFFSVKTGLSAVNHNHIVFIHNADNPFANQKTLEILYANRRLADIVKPVFNSKGGHPILISNQIVREIISTKDYDINLNDFLKNYSQKRIQTEDEKIILNVNTMDDYKKFFI